MADIHLRPSKIYEVRRRVPVHLQAVLGKKEIRQSLGTKDRAEAKRLAPAKMAAVNALFADAGKHVDLSHKDISGLAGYWLRTRLGEEESNPPDADGIELMLDRHYEVDEDGRSSEYMADEVDALLLREKLPFVSVASREALKARLFTRSLILWHTLARREQGHYDEPEALRTAPVWTGRASVGEPAGVSLEALWELWTKDRPRPAKTVYQWSKRWPHLAAFLGHTDASRVTAADAWAWADSLKTEGSSPATINGGYLGMASAVFGVAVKRQRLPLNPFKGVSIGADKLAQHRDKRQGFDDAEAGRYLRAARARGGWVQWAVFTMAYTGARLDEVVGARARDVRMDKGIPVLDLTLEGDDRTLKNLGSVRTVPLHSALIAEGLMDYARSLTDQDGSLFPSIPVSKLGKRSEAAGKTLGRMLRTDVGITDPRKVGGHSWRHRFATLCRQYEIPAGAGKAMTGHAASDEGDKYGTYPIPTLAAYLERIPVQG